MAIRKFSEVFGKNPDLEVPILQERFIGKTFMVESVRFGETYFDGEKKEYAVVTIDGKVYRTGSGVLCQQLHEIQDDYEKNSSEGKIQVTLRKEKNYFTFQKPKEI